MLQNGELEIVVDSHSKELSEAADKVSQIQWWHVLSKVEKLKYAELVAEAEQRGW